jgi:hypothetical protein
MLGPIVLGASCVATGLALRAVARVMAAPAPALVERASRLRAAKRFADAALGEDVVVVGTVEAGPEGPLTAPISGIAAAWVRVETTEERSADHDAGFQTVSTRRSSRAFHVVSSSVARVLVRPGDCDVDGLSTTRTGPVMKPSTRLATFLAEPTPERTDGDDFVRRREYLETALPIGNRVLVIGPKRGGRGAPDSTYREPADERWVEPEIADAALDEARICAAAEPEPQGIAGVLTWVTLLGGPLFAIAAIVNHWDVNAVAALFGPPVWTGVAWVMLSIAKSVIVD